jgi:alpha-tubulin suppressor-like RCC1 family protein
LFDPLLASLPQYSPCKPQEAEKWKEEITKMMMFSENLVRPSRSGRLVMVLMVGLAVAVALSMVFAGDAEAKKKKKKPRKPPNTNVPAPTPPTPDSWQPIPDVYLGESVARAWGDNSFGQLGNATTSNTSSQISVGVNNLSGVKDTSAGTYHSLALKEDGTVWAWGANSSGELGDGTTTERHTPVQVKGKPPTNAPPSSASFPPWNELSGFKDISAGERHSLALKEDGTVWTWGSNEVGQLGTGRWNIDSTTPVRAYDLSGVTAISAGAYHSLALRETGSVFAWGGNSRGQLGDETTTNRNRRVLVSNLSGVKTIDAGNYYSLALKPDGTVRAWGWNAEGQLGDGTTTFKNTPVQVSNLSRVKDISGGGNHSLAKVSEPPVAQQ